MRYHPPGPSGSKRDVVTQTEARQAWALAEDWWNPNGEYQTLHKYTSLRLRFLRERLARHFSRDPERRMPLTGLRIVDIGSGGGLLSENIAFLGGEVVGVDRDKGVVNAARVHAEINFVEIDYRLGDAEALAEQGERFDAVIDTIAFGRNADIAAAIEANCRLVKPGGVIVMAVRHRSWASRALAAVGAIHVAAILPDEEDAPVEFIAPDTFRRELARYGVVLESRTGIGYNRWLGSFRLTADASSAYFAVAVRPRRPTLTVVG